jgi:nitrite reductase (NO-forming)
MIQHVDWNHVYNEVVETSGGYPTAPAAATEAPAEETQAPAEANTYNVEMVDIAFVETELIVPANTDITINLTNTGASVHNFHIEELGVASPDLASGESFQLKFNTGAPAEYEFFCAIPGHREAGMVGKITVTDDPSKLPAPANDAPVPAEGAGEGQAPAPNGAAGGGTEFNVEAVDIAFVETELRVPANTEITINVTNTGAATHNLHIEELGVATPDLASGESATVTFNTGAPGEYEYFCAVPGHREAGMVGKLIVE